jgi:pteridine reductase
VCLLQADLLLTSSLPELATQATNAWGQLDLLINNASSFYPTPLGSISETQWDDLLGTNLKAPLFLAQALAPALKAQCGNIINIADIYAERPLPNYAVYSIAKAGLVMLTKALARELAPEVRVNAIAPGAILWPEGVGPNYEAALMKRIPLRRCGEPEDIARAVLYLAQAPYVTGQIMAVDGGRSISG